MNELTKYIWQFIISTSNATLEVPSLSPWRQTLKSTQIFKSYIINCPSKCLLECLLGMFTMSITVQETWENFSFERQKWIVGGKNAHKYSIKNSAFCLSQNFVKAVSSITDFGVSTAIITFFVGRASWMLDSCMKTANCNTKLTKKFISVVV